MSANPTARVPQPPSGSRSKAADRIATSAGGERVLSSAASRQSSINKKVVSQQPSQPQSLSSTTQQLQLLQQQQQSATVGPASFDPLLQLLEEPSSATQYMRHAVEITAIVEVTVTRGGFTVRQALDGVPRVLAHMHRALSQSGGKGAAAAAAAQDVAVLVGPVATFIEACAAPLYARTLDDQKNLQHAMGAVVDAVATMLSTPQAPLRATAAVTLGVIMSFIRDQCGDDIAPPPDGLYRAKRKEYWLAVRPSSVQQMVAAWSASLAVANEEKEHMVTLTAAAKRGDDEEEPDEGVPAPLRTPVTEANASEMIHLLKTCVVLSHYKSLCEALTDSGACILACRTMKLCTAGDRRITLCVELLWNLLQLHGPAAEACANVTCLQALYSMFVHVLSMGYKLKERELRNDMIVLVSLIADCDEAVPLLTSFAEILLDLSCGAELGRITGDVAAIIHPRYHHSTNHEELQMKTLCWKFLEKLCQKSETFAGAILDCGFMDVLLRYINVHCDEPIVVRWSTEQLLDLQRSVLNILLLMAPIGGDHLMQSEGIPILVEYTHECPDVSLRNLAVGVLAAIARTPLRTQLAECHLIQLTLELLQEQEQYDNALRVDCLSILADVVDRDPGLQREFLTWDGISVVLPLLQFDPDYYTDLKESVIFGALDCIWSCVAGSEASMDAFVQADGVHHLLCVLETCPAAIKRFPLTCLVDLLQCRSAAAEFRQWTSERTNRSATQLLLSLWTGSGSPERDEDAALLQTVSVDDVAVDASTPRRVDDKDTSSQPASVARQHGTPLGLRSIGASTRRTTLSARPASAQTGHPGNATVHEATTTPEEVAGFPQDKVATVRRGLVQVPGDIAEIVEDNVINMKVYCCLSQVGFDDHRELTALERSTLAAVQIFVELCKDEVWTAVADSIENDGLQPVPADQATLDRVRQVAVARCQELVATRRSLQEKHRGQLASLENIFYKTLIKKTDEAPPSAKASALSITEAKIRKALMLKASFKAAMAKQQAQRSGGSVTALGTSTASVNQGQGSASATPSPAGGGASSERKSLVPSAKTGPERWGLGQRAMTDPEYALLQMLNRVRTDPKFLIPHLRHKLTFLNEEGNAFLQPGKPVENAVEGAAPYLELIEMLEASRPVVTLLDVPMGMLLAARDHATDLSQRMEATQEGADGSTPQMRMNRYGRVGAKSSQLLSLGHQDALEIIMQLAVDDGIASRIDRKAIFEPDMRVCGVAIGRHSIHEHAAVVLLAHEYTDKPPNEQRDIYLKFNAPPARKLP